MNISPVLIIAFNRTSTLRTLIESLSNTKPQEIFIFIDGPRHEKDTAKQNEILSIIDSISWTKPKILHNSINLGCKNGPITAIQWFFDHVEEGVILEDDCTPNTSFLSYCTKMLAYYREDTRIMHINGLRILPYEDSFDLILSRYIHCWGWATWKRSWETFDISGGTFKKFIEENLVYGIYNTRSEARFWKKLFSKAFDGTYHDVWDTQWNYHVVSNNGLSIIPPTNMIRNMGYGEDATHTHSKDDIIDIDTNECYTFNHPKIFIPNPRVEYFIYKTFFKPKIFHRLKSLVKYIT